MDFEPYRLLRDRMREVVTVRSAAGVLGWDQETFLPEKGVPYRAGQLACLNGWQHRLATAPEVGGWIKACEDHGFRDGSIESTNVRGWRRAYDRAVKLPVELVEEISRTTSVAHGAWIEARRSSDFAHFQPHLEQVVDLTRRKADCWGWSDCRYDALLDEFEPGARTAAISALFIDLAPRISALIGPATERSARWPATRLAGSYPRAAQEAFNREVAEAIGFDFKAGRIDASVHPFCSSLGPDDTRLTTRYDEADFTKSLYGVLHETGHGLYDQGLNKDQWGLPAGDAASVGIHESQSRLWENHVGGTPAFWKHWLSRASAHFPHLKGIDPEAVAGAAARVSPSLIRVEADEVTYDLHIILRFEIERDLIGGTLGVRDVPAAWNTRFETLLGIPVPDDARGCLQDVHWGFGLFGYFATYTLGNLNASQLMHRATQDLPDLGDELGSGNYRPLLEWLREKVHRHGQRWLPQDLMDTVTGEPTRAAYHLDYLREKFL
jgi:carboxypeptidase Taq